MPDYSRKEQGSNEHLADLTSSRFVNVDGSVTTPITVIPSSRGGRLLKVVLNTNGSTLRLRTGSRVIGQIASDAPENTFNYGVYCENGLIVECGGALDATVVFD